MTFFLKNKILFGDSCSGKTYFYKKINIKKIDIDYFINYKLIKFIFEFFFRKIEKKILTIFLKIKNKYIIIGGGCNDFNILVNFLIYKNNTIINQKKNLNIDNFNRPTLKKNVYMKIRFCIRKKMYIKIFDLYINKCFKCNFKLL